MFPMSKKGPISIGLSPCAGAVRWTLLWRPNAMQSIDVLQADMPFHIDPEKNKIKVSIQPSH